MSALILYCATSMLHVLHKRHGGDLIDFMDWFTTSMPQMIDVTMWSQQFNAFVHFVKENKAIRIAVILGIRSFNPTVKVLW